MSSDRVVVIGAGVVGLCTAHYLREAGFAVTVVEKNAGVAEETSRQNGAVLTPSMSDPWNAPGIHWQLLKYLGKSDAPMLLRPKALHHYIGWGLRFMRNSTEKRFFAASAANLLLALDTMRRMESLRNDFAIDYTWARTGTLNVFRDTASLDAAKTRIERIAPHYPGIESLDAKATVEKEPVLAEVADKLVGGIYYPLDETGDAFEFCNSLFRSLVERGVEFQFETAVEQLRTSGGLVSALQTNAGQLEADKVVVAVSALTPKVVPGQGIHIKPVKGYSIAVPMKSHEPFPKMPVVDDGLHAAVSPVGDSLRLAGTAEFGGWNENLDPARVDNLWNLLEAVSPGLAANTDREAANPWCGFRPMSADGVPFVGETRTKGLYVNAGHGHLGWTQAAGSGALLADVIAENESAIDGAPYSPLR